MRDAQFDALVAAASGAVPPGSAGADSSVAEDSAGSEDSSAAEHDSVAVSFDGLRVAEESDGYRFETPELSESGLSVEQLRTHAAESAYVSNWYFWEWDVRRHGEPRRAFLRRLEAAADHHPPARYDELRDGLVTEWGQLRIEATLGDHGDRRYELRHVDEADVDRESLDAYRDPRAVRDIAETDADDRYRPLKTAPSLAGGWVFPDLDWRDLTEVVDAFYPATIANWHREQTGTLDVDHWRDTAERQTGIYGIIDELDETAVDRIAATCCADSQCLKRREWQFDETTELAADGGTGTFPCREPCSLVVAAARKWTTLERETEYTYEFTLTPSEKNQIEEIIDTVADSTPGDIREADVYEGANRYRARYLREKRLDDDGRLCGVPDEPDHDEHDHGDESHGDETDSSESHDKSHGDESDGENHSDGGDGGHGEDTHDDESHDGEHGETGEDSHNGDHDAHDSGHDAHDSDHDTHDGES